MWVGQVSTLSSLFLNLRRRPVPSLIVCWVRHPLTRSLQGRLDIKG
uniref:Uncharacterized protein n=1 Tax=Setaria viridis TaxID=4556 RepID=A0A4U6U2P3_SETVI|nr:hypothetical protein SEVIR_6G021825v2 [Setaria viridis]